MKRLGALSWIAGAVFTTLLPIGFVSRLDAARDVKPNILFFFVDDMGWQETSVPFHTEPTELNRRYHTPNMERLAREGMKFRQAYACAVCSPSRVSLMTGMNAARHMVTNWTLRKNRQPDRRHPKVKAALWNLNGMSPTPDIERTVHAVTLPMLLREAGYRTIHCGKAHFGAQGTPGEDPLNLGFDVNIAGHAAGGPGSYYGKHNFSAAWRKGDRIWDVPGLEPYHGQDINLTEALTREAIKTVEQAAHDKVPFYLYMSHYAIHAPWEKDERFYDKYLSAGLKGLPATYASMIESMDKSLGDLMNCLTRNRLADNTVVVFMSDNGQPKQVPRNKPLRGHKLTPYEGGVRVPMIIKWPGVTKPDSVCDDRYVIIEDVFPTFLEIAGVRKYDQIGGSIDGISFAPLLRGDSSYPENRPIYWHYPNTYDQPPYSSVRAGDFKLIYHHVTRKLELFNLRRDLSERDDLSRREQAKTRELAKILSGFLRETKAAMTIDVATGDVVAYPDEVAAAAASRSGASLKPTRPARGKIAVEKSPHAKLRPVRMDEVAWTKGFWADRFRRARTATIPAVEEGLLHPENSEKLDVLLIAAGLKKGERKSTDWTDGDCYKWIEAMARQFTVTGDPELARKMDRWIQVIAKAQSSDGYLSTNFWSDRKGRLEMPYRHEMYNMGHLLTAASVHYLATGKTTFLDIARKNADFLHEQFSPRPPRRVHFPWNPSAHMGLIDLYRATGEAKYLKLAQTLIDNRGSSPGGGTHRNGGTDQTQDRTPLRDETQAVGHAVCATYLYCGATDLYSETGEESLLKALERIWKDVTTKRVFLTGGVGTGSGHSTRGDPVHEAFLDDHELPNDCYCETCSNIGNAMWNRRLMNVTGDAKYADVMEQVLYNSGLSPLNIEQDRFFYCNPLEWKPDKKPTHKHRTAERWLVHSCYCCPPQMARTLSALQTWAYSVGDKGVWVNLYGGSQLDVKLSGETVRFTQTTDYPFNGRVRIELAACPQSSFSLMLRVPGWCDCATVTINGKPQSDVPSGAYAKLHRVWKPGDVVELDLPMRVRLMEAHPSVAENRNRIAVMRGPLVYCLELPLREGGEALWIDGIYFPENVEFTAQVEEQLLGGVIVLKGHALTTVGKERFVRDVVARANPLRDDRDWEGVLYRPFRGRQLSDPESGTVPVALIPYYAWANRGVAYMQVWTPLARPVGSSTIERPLVLETPESAFDTLKSVIKNRQWDSLWDLSSPSSRKQLEAHWAEMKKSPEWIQKQATENQVEVATVEVWSAREGFVKTIQRKSAGAEFHDFMGWLADAKILSKDISKAACKLKVTNGSKAEEIPLVREHGRWYFVLR